MITPIIETSISLKQEVAQPNEKVVQPTKETNLKSRLTAIESSIEELKKLIFSNSELIEVKSPKTNGLGRIRTGDLRHVKAPFCFRFSAPNPPEPIFF